MSAAELLQALPGVRIRDGRVIDVRGSMEKLLGGGGGHAPIVVHSKALAEARRAAATAATGAAAAVGAGAETASVQVKLPGAAPTSLVVRLAAGDTVETLRGLIERQRALLPEVPERFELRTAYPARVLSDGAATAAQAGLVPSATVFVRALP